MLHRGKCPSPGGMAICTSHWGEEKKVQPKLVVRLGAECRPALGMRSLCFHLHSSRETRCHGEQHRKGAGEGSEEGQPVCPPVWSKGRARATLGRRHWTILKAQQVPAAGCWAFWGRVTGHCAHGPPHSLACRGEAALEPAKPGSTHGLVLTHVMCPDQQKMSHKACRPDKPAVNGG